MSTEILEIQSWEQLHMHVYLHVHVHVQMYMYVNILPSYQVYRVMWEHRVSVSSGGMSASQALSKLGLVQFS